jgi:signal transduction histidine kinase/ActR/RegA family two-component response regulator
MTQSPSNRERSNGTAADSVVWRRTVMLVSAILATGVVLVVGLWAAIFALTGSEHDTAMEHARTEVSNLSAAFQGEVERMLDNISGAMELVSQRVRAQVGAFDIQSLAHEIPLLATPGIQATIIAPDGMMQSTTLPFTGKTVDLSDRDHFRVHLDGTHRGLFISKPVLGRVSGQVTIQISRRVDAPDGRFLGVLVFHLPPRYLTALHKSIDLGQGGRLTLFGTDNVVRARFGAHDPDGTVGVGASLPELPARSSIDDTRGAVHIAESPIDHTARIYSDRRVMGYPLLVGVGLGLDEVLAASRTHAKQIRVVGVVSTLLLCSLLAALTFEIRRRSQREAQLATDILLRQQVERQLRESEQRFRDIAEVGADWIWESDADHRFTFMAGEALANLERAGLSATGTLGKTRWELAGADNEREEKWRQHKVVLDAHKPFRAFRYSITGPTGEAQHFVVSGKPVMDTNGKFLGYRGTATQETQMVQTLQRAEQAETLLHDAVDSVSEGFVIYDSEDRLLLCNDAYRRLYPASAPLMVPGVKYEDLVRNSLAAGHYPEAAGREEEWLATFMRDHRVADSEVETLVRDGKWILVCERRMRSGGTAGLRINVTELKQAQAALRQSEARLDRAQEMAGIGSWELDMITGQYIWSRNLYSLRGLPLDSKLSRENLACTLDVDDAQPLSDWLVDLRANRERAPIEFRITRPDGEARVNRCEGRPIIEPDGTIYRLAGTVQDITDRQLIERQLAQAQKMEAIGNLTGGMAHDFNNLLSVVVGNLDLLGRLIKDQPVAEELRAEALDGAIRGTDLIRRLLAFARRQPLRPKDTDVNALVEGLGKLLSRTLGEEIELTMHLDPTVWPAMTDPVQLEAALTNLATNARDAMKRGGQLAIETSNAVLDTHYAKDQPEVAPGEYVLIAVSDTGTGIDPTIIDRIVEPFFTTKEPGLGTGLGLSMVFGFVKQSGGHLAVYSEPGRGSTFRLYLPRGEVTGSGPVSTDLRPAAGGDETVLVVEDNAQLRRAAVRQLTALGYTTFEAENAEAALPILAGEDRVDLLFSDVVMPGEMDGIDLAQQAAHLYPTLRVLVTSGFPDLRGAEQRMTSPAYQLLNKPYRYDELARAVRQALDGSAAHAGHQATVAEPR